MVLRLSTEDLRIRLSREEALELLKADALRETFPFLARGGFHVLLRIADAGLETGFTISEEGLHCRIERSKLLGALRDPRSRDPFARVRGPSGYAISIDVDVFSRDGE